LCPFRGFHVLHLFIQRFSIARICFARWQIGEPGFPVAGFGVLAILEDTIVSIDFDICIEEFIQTLIVLVEFFYVVVTIYYEAVRI